MVVVGEGSKGMRDGWGAGDIYEGWEGREGGVSGTMMVVVGAESKRMRAGWGARGI